MSENQNPAPAEDLKETCGTLQHQLNSVLILTCVVSLTLTVSLGLQFRAIQREVQAMRTMTTDYQTKTQPVLQDLSRKLVEYSKTHPDIKPLLDKYGVAVPTNAPVPVKK